MSEQDARSVSAKIFGNAKFAEVVVELDRLGPSTAQEIARATGLDHSLIRDVLVRLADAEVIERAPRLGPRAPQVYQTDDTTLWPAIVAVAKAIMARAAKPVAPAGMSVEITHSDNESGIWFVGVPGMAESIDMSRAMAELKPTLSHEATTKAAKQLSDSDPTERPHDSA